MAVVLVTGGAGYVGSHCVKAIARAGHTPVVFDSLLYGHREFVQWGELIEGDIRDAAALEAAIARVKPDAVMHFAALAYVGESVIDPGPYYDVNIGGTRILLDVMRRAGVHNIVFSSSCATYGQPDISSISEDTPASPINPYGFSKYVCEQMMEDYGRAYGLRSARLRYFNAAGSDVEAGIGEDHDPETHLIPLALDAAIGVRPSITIYGDDYDTPDGTAVRDYIHVDDLGRAHLLALNHLLAGGESLAVNLGTGAPVSVRQVIDAAEKLTGLPIPVIKGARRPGDAAVLVANPALAKKVLGWEATRSDLSTLLADAWRWHNYRFPNGKKA